MLQIIIALVILSLIIELTIRVIMWYATKSFNHALRNQKDPQEAVKELNMKSVIIKDFMRVQSFLTIVTGVLALIHILQEKGIF